MDQPTRRQLSRISLQGMIAPPTADRRRHLRRARRPPPDLDEARGEEPGWKELIASLAATFAEMTRIRGDAIDRIAASGDEVIPATVAMLGFESPPPPPLRKEADRLSA